MELFRWKYKSTKPIEIVALGDIHLGAAECDIDLLKKIVTKIKKRKCKVILMGDLLDMGTRDAPGASIFENNMTPQEQIDEIVKILMPIKDQILSNTQGNHEFRISRQGIDVCQIISEKLGCNYAKYQTVNVIQINKQIYNVFSTHGSGSGMTTESRVNNFKKYLEQIDADLILAGHCHDLHHRIFAKRVILNNTIGTKQTHLVLCGNMLDFANSYAEMKGYPILRKGCPLIKLYPNQHKVEVDLNWFETK